MCDCCGNKPLKVMLCLIFKATNEQEQAPRQAARQQLLCAEEEVCMEDRRGACITSPRSPFVGALCACLSVLLPYCYLFPNSNADLPVPFEFLKSRKKDFNNRSAVSGLFSLGIF